MSQLNSIFSALLLIGPTGAGKTPLGNLLEKRGLFSKRVFHFDFGETLRKVIKQEIPFPEEDRKLIQSILKEARLLKPEEFYLAENLLKSFILINDITPEDLLVLNGLPRNLYQAKKLASFAKIEGIIDLKIDFPTLLKRIQKDPALDRKGREDDLPNLIAKKLIWFEEENKPLIDFYKKENIKIFEISVTEEDKDEDLYNKLLLSISKTKL